MAALFYTNHRMNDVSVLFGNWRILADKVRKENAARQSIDASPSKHKKQESSNYDEMYVKKQNVPEVEHRFSIDYD